MRAVAAADSLHDGEREIISVAAFEVGLEAGAAALLRRDCPIS